MMISQIPALWSPLFLTFLAFFGFLANAHAKPAKRDLEPFELDEYLEGTFENRDWNGSWISDTVFIVKSDKEDLYKVHAVNLRTELVLTADQLADYPGNTNSFTADGRYDLIRYNEESAFRYSTTAQFAIHDTENKIFYDLANKEHLQLAKWAPVGVGLIYVFENDIYYVPTPEDVENPVQITDDGVPGNIYNGVPDWVYEEEALLSESALWFSPDGQRLVFASFDDTAVNDFYYVKYGEPGLIENQYPELVTLKYPKAGTENPLVSVNYVDLTSFDKTVIALTDINNEQIDFDDGILGDITWATGTDVVVVSLNRVQNRKVLVRCNTDLFLCEHEYSIEEHRGWLQIIGTPVYSKNGTKFLILASEPEGNDTYKHLSIVDSTQDPVKRRLTKGRKVVTYIYGWDEDRGLVYYDATGEDQPSQEHVYVINVDTGEDVCLTCTFETPEGLCKSAYASFSQGFSNYAKICYGPGPDIVHVQNTETSNYFVWEDNSVLRQLLSNKLKPVVRDFKVPLESGFTATARLLLPPELNETDAVKYPMLVNVYAGPNSNSISDAFSLEVENYFVTNRKYIYAYINGRGSANNGDKMKFEVYRRLGTVEIEDQIAVTKHLQDTLPYIDANRTGIWGWSYGGFATIWALIKDTKNVFKLGLAIAPVTSFIYYDTIYTERFMGLPTADDNLEGYNNTDTTRQVEALRNKTFFLIHGNADDNVHYQHSMLLAKALERADIGFYQQSYPDERHSLDGVLPHLYHTIDKYFNFGFSSSLPQK